MVAEGAGDLLVGESQTVGRALEGADGLLDREVSGLDEKRQDCGLFRLVDGEGLFGDFRRIEVDGGPPKHLHEERRRAGLEPPVLEAMGIQAFSDGDRIEHCGARFLEMVSVVPTNELGERLFPGGSKFCGEGVEVFRAVRENLLVRVAEKVGRAGVHREVREVVQVREDRGLGELRDARDKDEALERLRGLDHGVERLEDGLDPGHLRAAEQSEDRLVVFVHENRDLSGRGLRGGGAAEVGENVFGGLRRRSRFPEVLGQAPHHLEKTDPELLRIARLRGAHVEVQDGDCRPVPGERVDRKAPEEFAARLEEGLERRKEQRFPEPAGPREEVLALPRYGNPVNLRRLVDVDVSASDEVGKRERAGGNRLHGTDSSMSKMPEQPWEKRRFRSWRRGRWAARAAMASAVLEQVTV